MSSRQENIKRRRELMEKLRKREAGEMKPVKPAEEEAKPEAGPKGKKKKVVKAED